MENDILKILGINSEELTEIVQANPSLRGFISGYISEYKLRKILAADKRISNLRKYDDHDRTRKSDLVFSYKGIEISVEVKSLQTSSVRNENGVFTGKAQCDASDKRPVKFPDGTSLNTTCLLVGEFDLLAVNLFTFENKWNFVFAENKDLPRSKYRGYTPTQQAYLISSMIPVSWPAQAPFTQNLFSVLDKIVKDKKAKKIPRIKEKASKVSTEVLEIQESKNDSSEREPV
jgi:hypothetical protein